ncbi:MAG: OmpH family outer membrane protein, partial [Bacteroidales bacterium]|nr:OmpH family outer membrane protein [Bacteroidales bacterium]
MKKLILVLMVLGIQVGFAQNIAYIEMDIILEEMPEFQKASDEIDQQAKQWDSELQTKFETVETMYQEYVKNESTMSDATKQQKQEAIFQAEKAANDFKDEKFGQEGEIMTLQEEKFKPIYDKIFASAEKVAKEKKYNFVFDKSAESSWVYTNPEMDITDDV